MYSWHQLDVGASPISAQVRGLRAFIAKGMRGGSLGFFDVGQAKAKANESSSVDLVPDRKFNLVHRILSEFCSRPQLLKVVSHLNDKPSSSEQSSSRNIKFQAELDFFS